MTRSRWRWIDSGKVSKVDSTTGLGCKMEEIVSPFLDPSAEELFSSSKMPASLCSDSHRVVSFFPSTFICSIRHRLETNEL